MVKYRIQSILAVLSLVPVMFLVACERSQQSDLEGYRFPDSIPHPEINPPTAKRIALGMMLFFDPRLSGDNNMSCATCHNPGMGWCDRNVTGVGHEHQALRRNTPTILNSAFGVLQFWDGRAESLEDQALGPISSAVEMNQDLDELVRELNRLPVYKEKFESAYPGESISSGTIARALAAFERTIISRNSAFDRWVAGDSNAMSPEAIRGFEVFNGKARCSTCHQGFNFTDNGFHNIGVRVLPGVDETDVGRFEQLPLPSMQGAFKTPTLRDVTLTAPYMHNGIYATLEEVIDHYIRGGDVKEHLSPNMSPIILSQEEKEALIAFMRHLEGEPIDIEMPHLP